MYHVLPQPTLPDTMVAGDFPASYSWPDYYRLQPTLPLHTGCLIPQNLSPLLCTSLYLLP